MGNGVDFPGEERSERTVSTDEFFEREVYLSRQETASFLRDVAGALERGDELTFSGDDWELPFSYREPIEIEIEFTDRNERELELELEFSESQDGTDLTVE